MNNGNSAGKQLLLLLVGILMCGGGLFLFAQHVRVISPMRLSGFYGNWGLFGGRGLSGGMILIPLILGIVIWVMFPDNFAGKLVTMLAVLIIVFGIISTIELRLDPISLYELVIMLILIFGGGALALRILFVPDLGGKKSKRTKFDDINDKLEL